MVAAMRHSLTAVLLGAALGCSNEEAPKAWSALTTCLAGGAAQAPLAQRVKQLRLIQLANSEVVAAKDTWPARCAQHANQLYAAIPASGGTTMLKRKLRERLHCADDKQSCSLVNDEGLISTTTELWEAAQGAGLTAQPAAGVGAPPAPGEPAINAESWKSLSAQPQGVVGPRLAANGSALLLLRPGSEKGRPTLCEFAPGFAAVKCTPASAEMPEVPLRTVEFVRSASGVHVAALTETGLVAYDLASGAKSEVRGTGQGLARDGLAVEGGAADGLVAVMMKDGKAGKDIKLVTKTARNKPVIVGDRVIWLEEQEGGAELMVKTGSAAGLKDERTLKGPFSGPFHTCESDGRLAIATWERNASLPGAKPTAGEGKTQLAIAQREQGSWSKVAETTIPFERLAESELYCSKAGASMAYAARVDGVLQVARVECSSDVCKQSSAKLPNVDSKWWWAVAPMGDKTLIMWRGTLGETRLRVAAIAELDKQKDVLVFDTPDFGGPSAPDAASLITESGALFLFRNERPVALSVAPSGAVKVVSAK
jgi:hypothetical protein